MHLQFVHGWVLFLLWAVLALAAVWLLLYRRGQKALLAFLAEPMQKKLAPSIKPFRFYWQLALVQIGLLLLLTAAARPQWGMEERTVFQRGRDLIIALDVSRSMLARDVHPSRLQRAKADVQDLLRELRGDRVGLLTFRGHAVQICPLTTDYAYLEQILDDVTVESAPRGETNIGDAIEKALTAFETDEGAHRAMILISDGEDLAGHAKSAAEKARAKGVVIFTVGLGDPKGAKIPGLTKADATLTYQGKEVITKLQHETLKEIADITGGAYVPVGVANVKLGKLYSEHLSKISARDIEESLRKRMIERYQLFLFPGVLVLLTGALLSRGRLATRKRTSSPAQSSELNLNTALKRNACIAWLLLYSFVQFTFAATNQIPAASERKGRDKARPSATITRSNDYLMEGRASSRSQPEAGVIFAPGRAGASKAQQYYRLGAYDKSAFAYLHAMSNSNQRLQNDCLFNAGCAFYRAGDYVNAADSFGRLGSEENTDQEKNFYNLGCATYRLAEQSDKINTNRSPELKPMLLEKAGNAFQRSLRAKPDSPRRSSYEVSPRAESLAPRLGEAWAGGRSLVYQNAAVNLAAITNMLPKAREDAKIQSLLAKFGNRPPPQLADTLLENQRNVVTTLTTAITNSTPARIGQFEALAEQEKANTDILIPLKLSLASALKSQGQAAQQQIVQLDQHLEATRNTMNDAYQYLRNVDDRSCQLVRKAESGIYILWKGLASFEKLLKEDIRRQTNTITMTTSALAKSGGEIEAILSEQNEAHQLTGLFTNRFTQAVPPEGTGSKKLPGLPSAPMPDEKIKTQTTNEALQINAAIRTNILYLADQAVKAQELAGRYLTVTNLEASLPEQRRSYDLLKEIEKLLPKDKQNNQQNQQQNDQQKQDQQQEDENKQQDQQKPPEQKPPEQQPPPPEEQKPEKQKEQPQPADREDQKKMTPEQLRALLEKALEREKEHREQKMRNEYIPPSSIERDW